MVQQNDILLRTLGDMLRFFALITNLRIIEDKKMKS